MISNPPSLFDACEPRSDVLKGDLDGDQFAASLSAVAHTPDDTPSVYSDANNFFSKTYPTDGVKTLLTNIVGRILVSQGELEGDSYNSILCLDTTFGGGKTHDLIAVYHLARKPSEIENLPDFLEKKEIGDTYLDIVSQGLTVSTAAIVGSDLDAKSAKSTDNPNHPETKTLWGEIAYQLFGEEGYNHLKDYDVDKQAPGATQLKRLFDEYEGHSLILIDEIAEYLEAASTEAVGQSTLARQTLVFLLNLFETAGKSKNLTVVYSIADTAFTDKAEEVRKLSDKMETVAQRQREIITPTGDIEIGAVLRHRLFKKVEDGAAEKVSKAYYHHYNHSNVSLPTRVEKPEYEEDLRREYPFHPSLINTLSEKVDTLPKFQKTRDALRLLARAIYHLWNNPPEEYTRHLIRIHDLTPADEKISAQLNATLFELVDLKGAVKADIFNSNGTSHAQEEDSRWISKALPPLGSHLSVTVLWNSLAVGEKATGVTRAELHEAIGHPDVQYDHYDTALANLVGENEISAASWFLYDEDRIKFKGEPNLFRIIAQKKENVPDAQAKEKLKRTLKAVVGDGPLHVTNFPEEPADIPDRPSVPSLCVMHFDTVTLGGQTGNDIGKAPDIIKELYEKTASSHGGRTEPRTYKNYVLFIVPDGRQVEGALEETKKLEAINELLNNSQSAADLSDEQVDELRERQQQEASLLGQSVRNSYRHLFYVTDDAELTRIPISSVDGNGDTKLHDAVLKTLEGLDHVIKANDNGKAPLWMEKYLWQTGDKMTTSALIEQFARKPGLPFLLDPEPIRKTVAKAVNERGYAYWDGEEENAYWKSGDGELHHSNVKIGSEHILYKDLESLKKEHKIPDEEDKEEEGVEDKPEKGGDAPSPGVDVGGGEVSEGGEWEHITDMVNASRAFTEARDKVRAKGEGAAIKNIEIEVGGDSPINHGQFLVQKPQLKPYKSNAKAQVRYDSQAEMRDGDARLSLEFIGPLDAFTKITPNLESFSSNRGESRGDVMLDISLPEGETLDEGGNDLLFQLAESLKGTNLKAQVKVRGTKSSSKNE